MIQKRVFVDYTDGTWPSLVWLISHRESAAQIAGFSTGYTLIPVGALNAANGYHQKHDTYGTHEYNHNETRSQQHLMPEETYNTRCDNK